MNRINDKRNIGRVQRIDPWSQARVALRWGRISEHTTRSNNEGWQPEQEARI